MSSWKNIIQTRAHRERAQPSARKKLGLLEKHKDYVQRARNYQAKKKRLKNLQDKAAMRNPDEFYFKMAKTKTAVHL